MRSTIGQREVLADRAVAERNSRSRIRVLASCCHTEGPRRGTDQGIFALDVGARRETASRHPGRNVEPEERVVDPAGPPIAGQDYAMNDRAAYPSANESGPDCGSANLKALAALLASADLPADLIVARSGRQGVEPAIETSLAGVDIVTAFAPQHDSLVGKRNFDGFADCKDQRTGDTRGRVDALRRRGRELTTERRTKHQCNTSKQGEQITAGSSGVGDMKSEHCSVLPSGY